MALVEPGEGLTPAGWSPLYLPAPDPKALGRISAQQALPDYAVGWGEELTPPPML